MRSQTIRRSQDRSPRWVSFAIIRAIRRSGLEPLRSREEFEHMVTGYDAEIAYKDNQVQVFLDELERQGVLDDTAIIISADHGDNFGEHGIYSDLVCADEAIHHIPLIVRWPGVTPEGTSCDSMLYNVDLSATLCELAEGDIPEWYDGK